ncbi:serine/threonine-protein kinase PknD [Mycobacterium paragordonae]|uniref:non-specific serine/threonine protein kinase n=1 Tax=Mycobacterium paragordonae TaxID=1389713 RepID=A0A4R5WMZ4_9MYCO|nr:serine/threonine-protein kinase PknD [Mycobacterium paragordonae]MDP7738083.1 serine/threonine-protein kinase PknD [Mycobacterium paragordonae]TDK91622.1 serine/threonine protein kinase [Mycobacterium paragordonae]TDL03975.1 serine/threonine protein kinase [Mycobacterium paragordonae]
MQGTPFGRYRLQNMMGQGGMGEVWRAYDTATNRTVAIKLLPPQLATDQTFVQRFRREAEAAAQLNNPHIIPIHNYGEIDGRLYVDMRLVEGRDLEEKLANGPLPPHRAVHIIEQVAQALRAAHKVGLVHRDVKPSNILLDEDDFAYLIDFGIARGADDAGLTGSREMIGSWHYMAPERLMAQDADARADIYALTCVLYECLTGNRPFPGDSLESQVTAHLTLPPPRPSSTRPDLPPDFDAVIAKGMAKEPAERYQTVTELAAAAQGAPADAVASAEAVASSAETMAADAAAVTKLSDAATPPLLARLSPRARVALGAVLVALIAAVVVTTTVLVHRAGSPPAQSSVAKPSPPPSPSPTEVALPFAGLSGPLGVAVDGAGNVYVADNGNNRVVKLDAATRDQSVLPFSDLRYAVGVAVDGSGTVYVTDSYNERVTKLAAGAANQTVLKLERNGPHGVAVDAAGNLYLADWIKDRVLKVAAGTGAQTALPMTGLDGPEGVAVDGSGNVYVADLGDGQVTKLTAETGVQTTVPFFGLVKPWGVAVDGAGNVYVSDAGTGRVVRLAAETGSQSVLPFPQLDGPHGVAVDGAGNLYVAESGKNRVLKLARA